MKIDIISLYSDYSIHAQTEGSKHCRPGWVNTECPFCTGNPGLHLGYNIRGNYFFCWRCGSHSIYDTISALLNISKTEVKNILKPYKDKTSEDQIIEKPPDKKPFKLPTNITKLKSNHKHYLENRGFDPDKIQKLWGIKGTGPLSYLDEIDYRHRIFIPIHWNNNLVTFQTRVIRDNLPKDYPRYIACPKYREKIEHKHILYMKETKHKKTGLCVEGVTDVWKLGISSFATFGIKYTSEQVRLIAKMYDRVPVLFDPDPQAIEQAKQLVNELKFRGVDSFRISIETDPGSMSQSDADYLVKQLL